MRYSTKLRINNPLTWGLCAILLLSSCLEPTDYPPEPEIKFISANFVEGLDDFGQSIYQGLITFEFTDGDGDIGVYEGDTTINMFVIEYGILNGERQSPVNYPYTLPRVLDDENKSLKGEIDVDIALSANYAYDSLLYEIYIVDRSENSSNIITTPIIAL